MRELFHSNNNKFLIINDGGKENLNSLLSQAREINVDGVIFIDRIDGDLVYYDLFNIDGSRAEVSGNGLGCLSLFLSLVTNKKEFKLVNSYFNSEFFSKVQENGVWVGFDLKSIDCEKEEVLGIVGYKLFVPNPHFVIPDKNFENESEKIEFLEKVFNFLKGNFNVHLFFYIKMFMYSFERGVGFTESCGSGTVACSFIYKNYINPNVQNLTIASKGGKIDVRIEGNIYWILTKPQRL